MTLIRMSRNGEEFAHEPFIMEGQTLTFRGKIVKQFGIVVQENIEFQIPYALKDLRLTWINPYGWVLANESSGDIWTAGKLPDNHHKVEPSLI